jgi:hypothetical protein
VDVLVLNHAISVAKGLFEVGGVKEQCDLARDMVVSFDLQ